MRLTGVDLLRVKSGLLASMIEVQNQIVTCPDPDEYAVRLAEYEAEKVQLMLLLERVDKAIEKEAK